MGSDNTLGLAKRVKAKKFCKQVPVRCMVILPFIRNRRPIGKCKPIGIRSCYDEGKRCAETLFMDYHNQNQVIIKIIRILIRTVPI
jgi:UDP-glucuronate decarboxylase